MIKKDELLDQKTIDELDENVYFPIINGIFYDMTKEWSNRTRKKGVYDTPEQKQRDTPELLDYEHVYKYFIERSSKELMIFVLYYGINKLYHVFMNNAAEHLTDVTDSLICSCGFNSFIIGGGNPKLFMKEISSGIPKCDVHKHFLDFNDNIKSFFEKLGEEEKQEYEIVRKKFRKRIAEIYGIKDDDLYEEKIEDET